MAVNKKYVGSSFDSWLRAEGIHADVNAAAVQRILARIEATLQPKTAGKPGGMRRSATSSSRPYAFLCRNRSQP
jgi:hypothetical protein